MVCGLYGEKDTPSNQMHETNMTKPVNIKLLWSH